MKIQEKPWPQWSEQFIKPGFPKSSLLAGTEPAIWEALGRMALDEFNTGKQVLLRKALDDIGLGWVATNTTPFRIAVGALFDAARQYHEKNAPTLASTTPHVRQLREAVPDIHIETRKLPEAKDVIKGPINKKTFTEARRTTIWQHLETYGAYVIRQAVSNPKLDSMPNRQQVKQTKLTCTTGNGLAGDPPGVYMNLSTPPDWHEQIERQLGELLIGPGAPEKYAKLSAKLKRKSILLLSGEGAANWAHQDNNSESPPLQALLMLSTPQRDFTGGEFYVARQTKHTDTKINILRYKVIFESPGDLVIFQAGKNSGWWHGMLPVKAGDEQKDEVTYLRKALGMLQPQE